MNLHEECLLKYLLNPMHLFQSTEALQDINRIIKQGLKNENLKKIQVHCTGS